MLLEVPFENNSEINIALLLQITLYYLSLVNPDRLLKFSLLYKIGLPEIKKRL